jgi:hypothetical protein
MDARMRAGMTRRGALMAAIGGAALVGGGLGVTTRRALAQRAISSGGGIAGGGLIEGPDAAVQFSLFATRLPLGENDEVIISGRVQLADTLQGWRMESVEVAEYGPVEGEDENLRELRGTMLVKTSEDDEGVEYPFILRAVDIGGPGEGLDTLTLQVGGAVPATPDGGSFEFSYGLAGAISAGDIQLVDIALTDAGE